MAMIPPAGYYFVPTDEELITHYLLNAAMGLPLPYNQMSERDLYGSNADPWDVLSDVHWDISGTRDDKFVTFVFTHLSRIHAGKSRIARTTRSGTWKGQTSAKDIYKDKSNSKESIIGSKKMFSFLKGGKNGKGVDKSDKWTMYEYSLAGIYLDNFELKYKDLVLCRIIREAKVEKQHDVMIPIPERISDQEGISEEIRRSEQEIVIEKDYSEMQKNMSTRSLTQDQELMSFNIMNNIEVIDWAKVADLTSGPVEDGFDAVDPLLFQDISFPSNDDGCFIWP